MTTLININRSDWIKIAPGLTITDNPWQNAAPARRLEDDEAMLLRRSLVREGCAVCAPVFETAWLEPAIEAILAVIRAGLPPRYALVFDETLALLTGATEVLRVVFDAPVALVPDEFDAHYIPTTSAAAGAGPHRDTIGAIDTFAADGCPDLINMWLALTDATTDNGCIYALPSEVDPDFERAKAGLAALPQYASPALQSVRALPVEAGGFACWAPELLHWGGRSSHLAKQPRISLACYMQNADSQDQHHSMLRKSSSFPLEQRIRMIENVGGGR